MEIYVEIERDLQVQIWNISVFSFSIFKVHCTTHCSVKKKVT